MKKVVLRFAVLTVSLGLALGLAECVARTLPEFRYEMYYEGDDHVEFAPADAAKHGLVQGGQLPRGRLLWAPNKTFYICYRGDRGCARVDINQFSIRDRADLTEKKPTGQRRVVCLGDSFTFGWGVEVEAAWPRLIEPRLSPDGDVRTINCGSSGTLLVDEYWWGLRDRFGKFDPDVVVVTLCLNDLVAMPNVVALFRDSTVQGCDEHDYLVDVKCEHCVAAAKRYFDKDTGWLSQSRLWTMLTNRGGIEQSLRLDPNVDWGQWLIDLPTDWPSLNAFPRTHYEVQGTPPEATWKREGPQRALRAIRDWCKERNVSLGVVVWPLFQGLEESAKYPFETLHRVVSEFGESEGIPVLDLLPTFKGRDSVSLWVDPSDPHANEAAHVIAAKPIAGFVDQLLQKAGK